MAHEVKCFHMDKTCISEAKWFVNLRSVAICWHRGNWYGWDIFHECLTCSTLSICCFVRFLRNIPLMALSFVAGTRFIMTGLIEVLSQRNYCVQIASRSNQVKIYYNTYNGLFCYVLASPVEELYFVTTAIAFWVDSEASMCFHPYSTLIRK